MDKLDLDCMVAFGAIKTGKMSLLDFICWTADQVAEGFAEGRESVTHPACLPSREEGGRGARSNEHG